MSTLPTTTDVLVVGAGPTGLALSLALTRLGADVTTIDLATTTTAGARAAGVQPRTLEDLHRLGAADALVEKGLRGSGFAIATPDGPLLDIPFAGLDTPYPFVLQVPQSVTEDVLRDTLVDAGGHVFRGYRLLSLDPEFDAVTALVADGTGAVRAVRARYLAGCDGLHSGVRARAGIPFPGADHEQTFALADVRTDPPAEPVVRFTFSPDGMLLRSALPDGVVRLVATIDPATPPLDRDGVQALTDRRLGAERPRVTEVVTSSIYRVSSRMAGSFRAGRVFLAGDAAHVHSPAGGQGMNTGIQDAVNLAWKLAAVLAGEDAALLDTYDPERRPNAAALLGFTGRLTTAAELSDPAAVGLRDDVLRAVAGVDTVPATLARRLAQLDISYRTDDDARPGPVGRRLPPDGAWAGRLAWADVPLPDGTIARVRPDGYVSDVSDVSGVPGAA